MLQAGSGLSGSMRTTRGAVTSMTTFLKTSHKPFCLEGIHSYHPFFAQPQPIHGHQTSMDAGSIPDIFPSRPSRAVQCHRTAISSKSLQFKVPFCDSFCSVRKTRLFLQTFFPKPFFSSSHINNHDGAGQSRHVVRLL